MKKEVKRLKRHLSNYSSHSIHSRTHFSGPWERRELKESPIHGPMKRISPIKLLPSFRIFNEKAVIYNKDTYLLFYCYHFIYSEELFYGHMALMVIISEGKANFLERLLQANRDNRLEITHFEFLRKLGEGSYGTVFLAKHPKREELVAVKKVLAMRIKEDEAYKALRIMVEKEASCHAEGSAHVIKLLDTFTISAAGNQAFYFVYEYAEGGDLNDVIFRIHDDVSEITCCTEFYQNEWIDKIERNPFIMKFTKYVGPQILLGVSALHERGIIHLDLKPENILITKKGIVKISDLGLVKRYRWFHYSARAEFLTSLRKEITDESNVDERYVSGTLPYMETELRGKYLLDHSNIPDGLFDYQVTFNADYFSVGLIIFEIMTGFLYGRMENYKNLLDDVFVIFLRTIGNLPIFAMDVFKTFLPERYYDDLSRFDATHIRDMTQGLDMGITDLLISTCKPRKSRWKKYTIPVKVKREGRKVEENVICIDKIKENILLFKDVNFDSLSINGIPQEIIEFLDISEPLYDEHLTIDDVLRGSHEQLEDVYKWPYFDFHLPVDEQLPTKTESKDESQLAPEFFDAFRDTTIRSARPHENQMVEHSIETSDQEVTDF